MGIAAQGLAHLDGDRVDGVCDRLDRAVLSVMCRYDTRLVHLHRLFLFRWRIRICHVLLSRFYAVARFGTIFRGRLQRCFATGSWRFTAVFAVDAALCVAEPSPRTSMACIIPNDAKSFALTRTFPNGTCSCNFTFTFVVSGKGLVSFSSSLIVVTLKFPRIVCVIFRREAWPHRYNLSIAWPD